MTLEPRVNRRRRRTVGVVGEIPASRAPATGPELYAAAISVLPDLRELQRERYDLVAQSGSIETVERWREQDALLPLWSSCHRWDGTSRQVKRDWQNIESLYVYSDMRLRDIADLGGIPLRNIESASSRYGWADNRRTYRRLRERELADNRLSTLEDAARINAARERFTESGMALLRQAELALSRTASKITPRDVPMMMQTALKMIGAGTKAPTEYRHSVVDNPSGNAAPPSVNILNVSSQADADRLLAELNRRLGILSGETRAISPTTDAVGAESDTSGD